MSRGDAFQFAAAEAMRSAVEAPRSGDKESLMDAPVVRTAPFGRAIEPSGSSMPAARSAKVAVRPSRAHGPG